jgi:hypothetical protein
MAVYGEPILLIIDNMNIIQKILRRLLDFLDGITIQRLALIVAFFALFVTWYQACSTKDALKETRKEFEVIQRPLVSLGRKDGTVAEFVEPKDSSQPVSIRLYVQNGGQASALIPNIGILSATLVGPASGRPEGMSITKPQFRTFKPLLRFREGLVMNQSNGTGGPIPPQAEYVYVVPDLLSKAQVDSIRGGQSSLLLSGELEYCDDFGRYSCRLFQLNFDGPPINAFSEVSEDDCALLYSYPPPAPGRTYLLPCEQPEERVAREESLKQELAKRAIATAIRSPPPTPTP